MGPHQDLAEHSPRSAGLAASLAGQTFFCFVSFFPLGADGRLRVQGGAATPSAGLGLRLCAGPGEVHLTGQGPARASSTHNCTTVSAVQHPLEQGQLGTKSSDLGLQWP